MPQLTAARAFESKIVSVSAAGEIEFLEMHAAPIHAALGALGDLAVSKGASYSIKEGGHPVPTMEPWELADLAANEDQQMVKHLVHRLVHHRWELRLLSFP